MDVRGFHHLALQVSSLEKTASFYREVLGLKERERQYRPDGSLRSIWMDIPGTGGGFLALEEAAGKPQFEEFKNERVGFFLFALRIDVTARPELLAKLKRHNIEVVHQTKWSVYFRDPEGNRIALSHHPYDP